MAQLMPSAGKKVITVQRMKKIIRNITTMQLALMTAAAIISLRGLPMMAQEEMTMFFYIFFATFLFLVPAGFVAAELGSAFADRGGGVYTWVGQAFGKRMGFAAIFLQWIQNVVWYPTVLGFAAAAIAYTIGIPRLALNGVYVGLFSIAMYWFATLLTLRGTNTVSRLTSRGFLLGTVIPGAVIVILAIIWWATGHPLGIRSIPSSVTEIVNVGAGGQVHPRAFPHMTGLNDIAFLAGILLLFAGVEVHAVHAQELKNPQKQFPVAILTAAIISFLLFTLGSLAVALIVPYEQITLQDGLMVSFAQAFGAYNISWMTNILCLLVAFGALAGVMSWISGPSRGLLWTARDGQLPRMMTKTNKNGIQINILIIQGCIVTVLSSFYIFMSNVNVAFFLLSALTIGLYLVMYMMMYAAGIRLRYTQPDLERRYRVPGGKAGMWIIAGVGFLAVFFAFIVTFFPPSQLPVGSPALYTWLVVVGTVVFVSVPFIISFSLDHKRAAAAAAPLGDDGVGRSREVASVRGRGSHDSSQHRGKTASSGTHRRAESGRSAGHEGVQPARAGSERTVHGDDGTRRSSSGDDGRGAAHHASTGDDGRSRTHHAATGGDRRQGASDRGGDRRGNENGGSTAGDGRRHDAAGRDRTPDRSEGGNTRTTAGTSRGGRQHEASGTHRNETGGTDSARPRGSSSRGRSESGRSVGTTRSGGTARKGGTGRGHGGSGIQG